MKGIILSTIALIFLFSSCNKEVELIHPTEELHKLTLSASMPEERDSFTRIALTKDDKDVKLTWEDGDQLQVVFVQGELKEKRTVTVKNISEDRKKAQFDIIVPDNITDELFDLYGIYGGGGLSDSDPTLAILPENASNAGSLSSLETRKDMMLYFSVKELTMDDTNAKISFKHLGSLFCITVKNLSDTSLDNLSEARLIAETSGWSYNFGAGGGSYNIVTESFVESETAGSFISFGASANSLASGESLSFWGWYPPLPDVTWPELKLQLNNESSDVIAVSENSKPERTAPTSVGKSYHFYAVWTGTKLQFTDDTYTPPPSIEDLTITGDLRHAEGGDGFIGMVYQKGTEVFYNEALVDGTWSGEVKLGVGSNPRIAIGTDNRPNVVYVTDGKIAFQNRSGSIWNEVIYVESNNGGSCSFPDVAVDVNGFAHITYTDTRGNTGDYTNHPDIMYAVNKSGAFVKTLIYNGYYDGWEQSYKIGHYYNNGSRITLDNSGNFYILIHHQDHYRSVYSGTDNTYQVIVFSEVVSGAAGSTYGTNREDIYDIAYDGTNVVALYKTGNNYFTSQVVVNGTTMSFLNPIQVTPSITNTFTNPATLLAFADNRVIGGFSGSNLFTSNNGESLVYTDSSIKANTVVAVVRVGESNYAVYTDSSGTIRLLAI